ncbi:guanylate kinase [Alkalihalobacterium chitinilyticum]|uniref:Guanylate kinase n=1 Tax=Alkalihalobacterium chitinilyticum TaxID=2980103 RepID=A0ABT5VLB9_9BACI|nr:guanylate kinase [Alkalihalobacterium chitinilyticum]MDE5415557.1 guanylate kinase [Alkalihalobacterium chitinilyticum]
MYNLKESERIFVFTGPDGSGRKTVAKLVGATFHMNGVVSHTTRTKRRYETEGVDYHYLSEEDFLEAHRNGEFLEKVEINGYLYGIKEKEIEEKFKKKGCIWVVLNTEGADILKEMYGDKVIRIFVYADEETVRRRQYGRGDSDDVIQNHLEHYNEDMAYKEKCEYVVENYELSHTTFEIANLVEKYLEPTK